MPLEFARAVQCTALNGILREHLLPQLAAAAEVGEGDALATPAEAAAACEALWLHFADEAMQFEKRCGVRVGGGGGGSAAAGASEALPTRLPAHRLGLARVG